MLATTLKNTLPTKKPIDIVGNNRRNRVNLQTTIQTPIRPDRRNLPSGACLPAGGKQPPVWGCAPGFGPPGKAMTEKVVASDPRPRGEGRMPQGQEQEGRRKRLPRELRIKLYEEVKKLRRNGLTYKEIIEQMWRRYGVRMFESRISEWLHGIHSPYNGRYIPSIEFLKPSKELAYVIGTTLGDGYTYKTKHVAKGDRTTIALKVKDREFAVEFGRCLTKVLGRRPVKPRYYSRRRWYNVEVRSQTLYELLKKPADLDRLRKYIEHCKRCMAAFLKGLVDSEGHVNKRGYIYMSNTDYELLTYVKDLLKRLGIESTGPWTNRQQGKIFYDPNAMKRYMHNNNEHYIYIKANSNMEFYEKIGFTISRKQKRLEKYIKKQQTRKH
jgi:intein-encoded DNA endonuclease-like protein